MKFEQAMPVYLTQRQVAEILQVSMKTLQLLRRRGKISYSRLGHRSIRFRKEAVIEFMRRREMAVQAVEHMEL